MIIRELRFRRNGCVSVKGVIDQITSIATWLMSPAWGFHLGELRTVSAALCKASLDIECEIKRRISDAIWLGEDDAS
jgi:hypothetical protein